MIDRPTDAALVALATDALEVCRKASLRLTTAESCTGGLIVGALTEIGGSSDVVGRGFVTYSNEAKMEMLGVAAETLAQHGAVSEATVAEMTAGALKAAGADADIAISVRGVAGPGGGPPETPAAPVWLAAGRRGRPTRTEHCLFAGDRADVRLKTVARALELAIEAAGR